MVHRLIQKVWSQSFTWLGRFLSLFSLGLIVEGPCANKCLMPGEWTCDFCSAEVAWATKFSMYSAGMYLSIQLGLLGRLGKVLYYILWPLGIFWWGMESQRGKKSSHSLPAHISVHAPPEDSRGHKNIIKTFPNFQADQVGWKIHTSWIPFENFVAHATSAEQKSTSPFSRHETFVSTRPSTIVQGK